MSLLAVLLGILVWQDKPEIKPIPKLLTNFDSTDVIALTLRHENKIITLERSESNFDIWLINKMVVSTNATNSLLKAISNLQAEVTIPPEQVTADNSAYGFNPPPLSVVLDYASAKQTLYFGELHSLSSRRYLRITKNDSVFLVNNYFFNQLNKKETELLEKKPFLNENFKDVTGITMTFDGKKNEVEGNSRLFSFLKDFTVLSYVEAEANDHSAKEARIVITSEESSSPLVLSLGKGVEESIDENFPKEKDEVSAAPRHAFISTSQGSKFSVIITAATSEELLAIIKENSE